MNNESTPEIIHRAKVAVSAAREAGTGTLDLFRSPTLSVQRKGDGSPVTQADRAAENHLRSLIAAQFPDDGIIGEEFGELSGNSGFQWVLDPIDGTKSFVTGVPLYTTLVAVLKDDEPLVGVVFAPATGEMAYAVHGGPTYYCVDGGEPAPTRVSNAEHLEDATFLTSEVASFGEDRMPPARNVYEYLEQKCRLTRTWGDAYGYLLVATGRADVMIDPVMNLWDAAPLKPIIEGAGGKFTDWQGVATVHSGDSVAANPMLIEQVLAVTRGR